MDPSLLEQFLGPSSTQFQLPSSTEDENDELHPLVTTGFQRLSHTRKSLPGKNYIHIQGLIYLLTHIYKPVICVFGAICSSFGVIHKECLTSLERRRRQFVVY
jgi:hypothetical protein